MMKLNPLIELAGSERHQGCCTDHACKSCGSPVSTYNANDPLVKQRREAEGWDYWCACDNADCEHAYGEGMFQDKPDWVAR
jgi:hypothetical protein